MFFSVFDVRLMVCSLLFSTLCGELVEMQSSADETAKEMTCNICHELSEQNAIESNVTSLNEQLEESKKNVQETLEKIEMHLKEINDRVWWLPKNDLTEVYDESQAVVENVARKVLSLQQIDVKTTSIRSKIDVYEAEKETNKAKAIEQWRMLCAIRERLHDMENEFLNSLKLAEGLTTVMHIDRLRVLANAVGNKLKEVIDYYAVNVDVSQRIYANLHEIAVKKVELQTKGVEKKKKCAFLFFFCD